MWSTQRSRRRSRKRHALDDISGNYRLATVGTTATSFVHQLGRGLAGNLSRRRRPYWSAEWLPPHDDVLDVGRSRHPVLWASCAIARLVVEASSCGAGTSGAAFWAMVALVVPAGYPRRGHASSAAPSLMALPWGRRCPRWPEQVGAPMLLAARHGPQVRDVGALECTVDEYLNAGQGRGTRSRRASMAVPSWP